MRFWAILLAAALSSSASCAADEPIDLGGTSDGTHAPHLHVHVPDVDVITSDRGGGRSGIFHFIAVDDPRQPRYLYGSDTARHVVHRKDVETGVWEVFAGKEGREGARDGRGHDALFNRPTALCVNPAGALVVADWGNACLRIVSPDGEVRTLAGVCGTAGTRDGPGEAAFFSNGIRSIACLANCSVLVADETTDRLRTVLVHDAACAAAGAAQGRLRAGPLVLTGFASALVALLAGAGLALLWRRQQGSGPAAGYGQLAGDSAPA